MVQRIFAYERCSNVSRRVIAESCWHSPYVLKTQRFGFFHVSLYRKQVSLGLKESLESVTAFIKTSKRGRFYQDIVWKRHAHNSHVYPSKKFNACTIIDYGKIPWNCKTIKKKTWPIPLYSGFLSSYRFHFLNFMFDLNLLTRISLSGKYILEKKLYFPQTSDTG